MADQEDPNDAPPEWNLPSDVIVEILCRTDPSTIGRCRMLSHHWNEFLTSWEFLHKCYNFNIENQRSICIHLFFPSWNGNKHSIIRVDAKTGRRLYCTLPPQLHNSQNLKIVGIENGIFCFTYDIENERKQIVTWNMLTQTSRQIPLPEYFRNPVMCDHFFALTYIPQSTTYCIMHAFKLRLNDLFFFYTVYSSATGAWSQYSLCEANMRRLGSDYLSLNGSFYWLKYTGEDNAAPESVISYSVVDESWNNIAIPTRCRAGPHKLLNYMGNVSIASYPVGEANQYMIVVRSLMERRNRSHRWIAQLKLEGLRRYEQPKFFIDEDLITLTEEAAENENAPRQILLSRIRELEDYLRRHLQCGIWPADIHIQAIAQYSQGLFPV